MRNIGGFLLQSRSSAWNFVHGPSLPLHYLQHSVWMWKYPPSTGADSLISVICLQHRTATELCLVYISCAGNVEFRFGLVVSLQSVPNLNQ